MKIYICNICNKSIKGHGGLILHKRKHEKDQLIEETKFICECCGEEFNGKVNNTNRFCSKKCARIFSTKRKRKEINKKVSEKLKKEPRKVNCVSCNKEINLNKKRKIQYCDDCRSIYNYRKLFEKLNIIESNLKIANEKAVNLLQKEYYENKLSLIQIRDKYGIQFNTTYFFLNKNKVKLRNFKNCQFNAIEENRRSTNTTQSSCGPFKSCKQGWHKTWNNKDVYLRSSNELNYAKKLDTYKIDYEVEKIKIRYFDSIQNKERIAIVDFYLIELNMLVEIKSSFTFSLQNIKDRFKAYKEKGYNYKLILDNKEEEVLL